MFESAPPTAVTCLLTSQTASSAVLFSWAVQLEISWIVDKKLLHSPTDSILKEKNLQSNGRVGYRED